jgi:hypothetical protein
MIPSMVPVNKNLQFQVKYQLYTCNSKGTKIYKNPNLKTWNNYNAPAKKNKKDPNFHQAKPPPDAETQQEKEMTG